MNEEATSLWLRAKEDLKAASVLSELGFFDAAASRAYYAAFSAVSALFAAHDATFRRHSQIESAVHRDLVHSGRWGVSLGADFSFLRSLRATGDYGVAVHVGKADAQAAIQAAQRIVDEVAKEEQRPFDPGDPS
jgi:uncharacterized protein (UPF0332 family)